MIYDTRNICRSYNGNNIGSFINNRFFNDYRNSGITYLGTNRINNINNNQTKKMKYLIGITASKSKIQNYINDAYINAFKTKDTTPIIIPNLFEFKNETISKEEMAELEINLDKIAETMDALVLSGGADINPLSLGEKIEDAMNFNFYRDFFETKLVGKFMAKGKPVLGICRGFQILGNMYKLDYFQQNISIAKEEHDGSASDITLRREPMHSVHLFGEFKEYCGMKDSMLINSWHKQGFTLTEKGERIKNAELPAFVKERNKGKAIDIIMSTNYVIEGIEDSHQKILAFQNHPEEYENSIAIRYFISKYITKDAENNKESKEKDKESKEAK